MRLLLLLCTTLVPVAEADIVGPVTVADVPKKSGTFQISNPHGPVTVTCSDAGTVTATVDFVISGDPTATQALKAQIQPKASKTGDTVTVSAQVPDALPKGAAVHLLVTMPREGAVTATGGDGALTVLGCGGTLTATNTKGLLKVDGRQSQVQLESRNGDIDLRLSNGAITAASYAKAPEGNITMQMPDFSAELWATGSNITMQMPDLKAEEQSATSLKVRIGQTGQRLTATAGKAFLLK